MGNPSAQAGRLFEETGRERWPEQISVRIAWYYYVLGLTQQEIAAKLGINRIRVNRLLAEARRRGIVRVTIHSKLAENVELEDKLSRTFGLESAEVVIGDTDDENRLAEIIGAAAALSLGGRYRHGMTIGIAWGVTLKALAQTTVETPLKDVDVVSMLGSFSRRSSKDSFEATTDLAARLNAECYYLPGPIVCDSEEGCDTILQQPMVREVYAKVLAADLALVSVGGLDSSTIRRMDFVTDEEFRDVMRAGAIGNFLGYYIDENAEVLDHPINRRVIGLRPGAFRAIPSRVMISGGPTKVRALRALLERGYLTELFTDQDTARAILA